MPCKLSEILEEARALPHGERAELIEQLIADSAKNLDPEIEKPGVIAWGEEALRRLADLEGGKGKLIPGKQISTENHKIAGLQ